MAIEYRWAEGQYDRLPDLAADLVHSGVEVIAASGGCTVTGGAKGATGASLSSSRAEAIPDARGFVSSLSRPGANMTGVAPCRRVGSKAAGASSRAGPQSRRDRRAHQSKKYECRSQSDGATRTARVKGVQLYVVEANAESDLETAFASLASRQAGALVVGADPFFNASRAQYCRSGGGAALLTDDPRVARVR